MVYISPKTLLPERFGEHRQDASDTEALAAAPPLQKLEGPGDPKSSALRSQEQPPPLPNHRGAKARGEEAGGSLPHEPPFKHAHPN